MNHKQFAIRISILLALLGGALGMAIWPMIGVQQVGATGLKAEAIEPMVPVGSGFTYQGRLTDGGNPANGNYDFRFMLYDASVGGSQIGNTLLRSGVVVTGGAFTTSLDFGTAAFYGEARYLQIEVKPAGGPTYTLLSPRQALTPTPYASSAPWFGVSGKPAPYTPLRTANIVSTIDLSNNAGQGTSVTIGADGLGLMSYYDGGVGHLKIAHCSNPACSISSLYTLDSTGNVGRANSITLGSDGLGIISYYDSTNGDLKVAHCNNILCSTATISVVDAASGASGETSITIGSDGLAIMSYYSAAIDKMRVAHCSNLQCTTSTLASPNYLQPNDGFYNDIAIDADGRPVFATAASTTGVVGFYGCADLTCSGGSGGWLVSDAGAKEVSLALGSHGEPIVVWENAYGEIRTIEGSNIDNVISLARHNQYAFRQPSIQIGADGLPIVSVLAVPDAGGAGQLGVARCRNSACAESYAGQISTSTQYIVPVAANVGTYSDIAIGVDGLPLISFYNSSNTNPMVLHCSSPYCVPYLHR